MTARPRPGAALWKRLLPYVIAAAAVAWVLRSTNLHALKEALARAPVGWFIAASIAMVLLNCAADTFAMGRVFTWFGCHVRFRDLFVVRAATYLVAVVNYVVGQAAIVGFLTRGRRIPVLRASGFTLFIIGVNFGTLFILASAGATQASGTLHFLRWMPAVCGVAFAAYAGLLLWKPRVLARSPLLSPLFEMGIRGHIRGVLVRLPHVVVLSLWHFTALRMFGLNVPPEAALLYLPAYFAVASLPVNVNGIGLAQAVAIAFFARYADIPNAAALDAKQLHDAQTAAVAAYSFSTSIVSMSLQVLLGIAFVRKGARLGLGATPVDAPVASAPPSVSQASGG